MPYTKINSKWIKGLNERAETIKLLEESIGRTRNDVNQSKIFYNPPHRVMVIKTKIKKWDIIKLKSFCTAKETTNKMKKQPSEWEKIRTNETTDRINFQNIQAAHKSQYQKNNPIKPWENDLNRHFFKEDIHMANKHMERC